jgi:hypothetical protein
LRDSVLLKKGFGIGHKFDQRSLEMANPLEQGFT